MAALEGEQRQEVSATDQVERWLHTLLTEQTASRLTLRRPLYPLKPANRRSSRCNPAHGGQLSKVCFGRQKENYFQSRRRRRAPTIDGPRRQSPSTEASDSAHHFVQFEARGSDALEQLKSEDPPKGIRVTGIRTLMDWKCEDSREVSDGVGTLLSCFWKKAVPKVAGLLMHNSFPQCLLYPVKVPKSLPITRKCVSHRYSDLFRESRMTPFPHYQRDAKSNRQSQGPSTSVTPIHMRTEGNGESRSESPQLFTSTYETRPAALITCVGFSGFRVGSATRMAHSTHPYQDASRTVFPCLPALDGPLLKLQGRVSTFFRSSLKDKPRRRSFRRTIQPSPVRMLKYQTPQRAQRPAVSALRLSPHSRRAWQ